MFNPNWTRCCTRVIWMCRVSQADWDLYKAAPSTLFHVSSKYETVESYRIWAFICYGTAQRICTGTAAVYEKLWPTSGRKILLLLHHLLHPERSAISVTPQLLALGNCSGRGGETKYLHPCWDMNLDIWACGSYPMQYCWVYYNERMLQQSFINKISSTHARITCRAFLLWLERHSSSLYSFVRFSYLQSIKVKYINFILFLHLCFYYFIFPV
jgi:hypothetical protein